VAKNLFSQPSVTHTTGSVASDVSKEGSRKRERSREIKSKKGEAVKKFLILLPFLTFAACEVAKTPVPTGGSKSDGLVAVSYDVGPYEVPLVDWEAAQASATKRCNAWGYPKADPFEGVKNQCSQFTYSGCAVQTVTRTYQCTR
jgi:hypothetical protein